MATTTRRRAMVLVGIGVGTALAPSVRSPSLLAQTRAQLPIGTAGKGGFFFPLGTGIAAAISKYTSGIEATAVVTGGAAENMKSLYEGKFELALAQADVAWSAAQGKLDGLPDRVSVRTLCGTVTAYVHLVTLEGLGINSVADLKGKRVSSGLPGTGTSIKALRVLEVSGVTPDSLQIDTHQDYPEAAQALKEGKIDAFAWDATLPGKAIVDLTATPGVKIRLLSCGEAVPQMVSKYGPFYFVAPIPKGTYPGVDEDIPVAAGKTLFVTDDRLDETHAYEITKAVLEHIPELSAALPAAKEISPLMPLLDLRSHFTQARCDTIERTALRCRRSSAALRSMQCGMSARAQQLSLGRQSRGFRFSPNLAVASLALPRSVMGQEE
jgi:TRAP transporter TAXI family solute receptor